MQPAAIKCPNCNAPISSQSKRCQYCGTQLSFRNNILTLEKECICPDCGESIGSGSYFCIFCGKLLTRKPRELSILRIEQKRIQHLHNQRLSLIPEAVRRMLEAREFVFYVVEGREGSKRGKKKLFIVTERRIIVYFPGKAQGFFSRRQEPELREIKYDEILEVLIPSDVPELDLSLAAIECFKEEDKLLIFFPLYSSEPKRFSEAVDTAFNNFRLQRKDINAILCFADGL